VIDETESVPKAIERDVQRYGARDPAGRVLRVFTDDWYITSGLRVTG